MACSRNRIIMVMVGCFLIITALVLLPGKSGSTGAASKDPSVPSEPAQIVTGGEIKTGSNHRVLVYYFHGTARCFSCRRIEELTKTTVEENFHDDITDGMLEFRAINVEPSENNHFIKDYGLYTKSVIVSDFKNDSEVKWKNLTRIWELFMNEAAFRKYITDEIREYLEGENR